MNSAKQALSVTHATVAVVGITLTAMSDDAVTRVRARRRC